MKKKKKKIIIIIIIGRDTRSRMNEQ